MNDKTNGEAGWTLSNVLAVLGFAVLIVLLAWLAIQVVRLIPTAFDSLAEILEDNQRELEEDRDKDDDNPVVVGGDDEEKPEEEPEEEEETPVATSTPPAATSTPVVTPKPTPKPVQYRTVTTYKVPVSDPNGRTDLAVSLAAVGRMDNERFFPAAQLSTNESSGLQFKVKNIGTKTSGEWRFVAELPGGGTVESPLQRPLGPSEVATFTIEFETDDEEGKQPIGASIYGGNDVNTANNSFRALISIR